MRNIYGGLVLWRLHTERLAGTSHQWLMHLARKELLEWLVRIETCNIYGGLELRKPHTERLIGGRVNVDVLMHLAWKELLEWLVGIETCNIYRGHTQRDEKGGVM